MLIFLCHIRHVNRVADLEGDALEAAYEKRLKRKSQKQKQQDEEENKNEVDRVDALPVKTLDGKLHYRTCNYSISLFLFLLNCESELLYMIVVAVVLFEIKCPRNLEMATMKRMMVTIIIIMTKV